MKTHFELDTKRCRYTTLLESALTWQAWQKGFLASLRHQLHLKGSFHLLLGNTETFQMQNKQKEFYASIRAIRPVCPTNYYVTL